MPLIALRTIALTIIAIATVATVSAGAGHTCAIREDGAIQCWEANGYGQSGVPTGIFRAVSAGGAHACAIRDDGVTVCWGDDDNDGEYVGYAPTGSITTVSAGQSHTCGLLTDGGIECWGRGAIYIPAR